MSFLCCTWIHTCQKLVFLYFHDYFMLIEFDMKLQVVTVDTFVCRLGLKICLIQSVPTRILTKMQHHFSKKLFISTRNLENSWLVRVTCWMSLPLHSIRFVWKSAEIFVFAFAWCLYMLKLMLQQARGREWVTNNIMLYVCTSITEEHLNLIFAFSVPLW